MLGVVVVSGAFLTLAAPALLSTLATAGLVARIGGTAAYYLVNFYGTTVAASTGLLAGSAVGNAVENQDRAKYQTARKKI